MHGRVMATISKFIPQIFETYLSSYIDRLLRIFPNSVNFQQNKIAQLCLYLLAVFR